MAANGREDIRPTSFDTPIAQRTRSKRNNKLPDISKLQLIPPESPSQDQFKLPQTPDILSSEDDLESDNEESPQEPSRTTPAAQIPEELQRRMFPPTKDEQIVNTALLIFLNALTIHFDDNITSNWTIHRKGFIAKFTKASFEARTDGYLDDGEENAYALIEVKPVIRSKKENVIRMQESAQMVGWLMNDSGEGNTGKM
ncbi:hypothetical protein CBS147320_10780 [Aspergillus niger]|nr:hypothetical protein CBS133816_10744 [Aspergillus niger]KAI2840392.1 hypothetical protein CBS11350_6968 [Aspergillus niger]KAI2842639.1 hypothetical protein CBS12448_10237 [Aspergillus niger]KAI2907159.1 hypothetical protein CBS147371_10723 [Aspergillus niger]KAI2912788.1 hypothetical protein CBS147320_10780 [Aspergillus niger]